MLYKECRIGLENAALESSSLNTDLTRSILSGLAEGLTQFSGPSRVALIYALDHGSDLYVFDQNHLLSGFKPQLEKYFHDKQWRPEVEARPGESRTQYLPERLLNGLVSCGTSSSRIYYQMWFTEAHPNSCSVLPTGCWLGLANHLHSRWSNEETAFTRDILCRTLKTYAPLALAEALHGEALNRYRKCLWFAETVEESGQNVLTKLQFASIVEVVVKISTMKEEGKRPRGRLFFLSSARLEKVDFLVRLKPEQQPGLTNTKHVRKMLSAVEGSDFALICDEHGVRGIARSPSGGDEGRHILSDEDLPERLEVDFQDGRGVMRVGAAPICTFADGLLSSRRLSPDLSPLEKPLLRHIRDWRLRKNLIEVIRAIASHAVDNRYGCLIALDLGDPPTAMPGQSLAAALDLKQKDALQLAIAMAKIDGAVHIDCNGRLHAFACLLDGLQIENEERSRGARFNASLRFSAAHPERFLLISVSEDGPLSVFENGAQLNQQRPYAHKVQGPPPTLTDWLGA